MSPSVTLTGRQVRHLRALAHHLSPLVSVGKEGVTDAVIQAARQALSDHELIKVKLPQLDKGARKTMAAALGSALGAHDVEQIGRVLVLYSRHPTKPKIELPK